MELKKTRAYIYAKWAAEKGNEKIPKYVRLQAEAWIKIADGEDREAYISEKHLRFICGLLKIMIHPDLGKPLYDSIEDYMWLFLIAIFCTRSRETDEIYYRTATLEICRKNFKTFAAAIAFIIAMLTMPRFSRFFSVAPDLKLSKELQSAIQKIIKSSPVLCNDRTFKTLRSEIRCNATDSEYIPLAYSEDKMDGKLATMFLADEAAAMGSYPIEAMRSSQITLYDKLGIIISTQYPNDTNGFIDEIDKAKKVLDGLRENRRYFSLLYEPDEEIRKAWQTNDNVIFQSNPVAVAHRYIFDDIKEKREDAVLYENKRENFLCKHTNIMFKGLGAEGYIDVIKVKECKQSADKSFWRGKSVFLGLDLSQTEDNTALAMVSYDDEDIYAKVFAFIPTNRIDEKSKKENVDYKAAIKAGECFSCGSDVIDYGFVESVILGIEEEYGVHVVQLGFDRYNAISTVQKLENADNPIECVEIRQHSSLLHRPTKLLKEKILNKKFHYDENRLLEINFSNARCTEDTNLNKYVNKKRSSGKVDMVVALINALYILQIDMEDSGRKNWTVQMM